MPYHLMKYPKGYKVMDDKGREYSNDPLPLRRAKAQMRALYASAKMIGSGMTSYSDKDGHHLLLHGEGFITDIFAKAKKAALGAVTAGLARVAGVIGAPIRTNYPPKARAILSKYAKHEVDNLIVRREPIVNMINTALNFLSMGRWQEVRDKLGYDKLFHLSMIVQLKPNAYILVEKNEVINITDKFKMNSDKMEYIVIPVPKGINFFTFMGKAAAAKGEQFFKYDAFRNNCQMFIDGILTANGVNTTEAQKFINQDTETMLSDLPEYVSPFASLTTNIAGLADRVLQGEGIYCGEKTPPRGDTQGTSYQCFKKGIGVGIGLSKKKKTAARAPAAAPVVDDDATLADMRARRRAAAAAAPVVDDDATLADMRARRRAAAAVPSAVPVRLRTPTILTISGRPVEFSEETAPGIYRNWFDFDASKTGQDKKLSRTMLRTRIQKGDTPREAILYVLERRLQYGGSNGVMRGEGHKERDKLIFYIAQTIEENMGDVLENELDEKFGGFQLIEGDGVVGSIQYDRLDYALKNIRKIPEEGRAEIPKDIYFYLTTAIDKKDRDEYLREFAFLVNMDDRYKIFKNLLNELRPEAAGNPENVAEPAAAAAAAPAPAEAAGDEDPKPIKGKGRKGKKVVMSRKDYMEEHSKLIKLLDDIASKAKRESNKQKAEPAMKGGRVKLTQAVKDQMARDRAGYAKDMLENPEKFQATSYDPSEGGTKEPCFVNLAYDNKEGGLNPRKSSMGFQTPYDCANIQKIQSDESRRRQYNNMSGFQKFAQGFLNVVTPIADVASNIIPGVSGQIYQQFAPPGSAYYSGEGKNSFFGLSPEAYLKKARAAAKAAGYANAKDLQLANDGKHKLKIVSDKGRTIKFGKLGMKDFILWKHTDKRPEANKRRINYLARSERIRGNWADDIYSKNSLARRILWSSAGDRA